MKSSKIRWNDEARGKILDDAARTAAREARGVRVLPFSNADAMRASDGTLDTIMAALAAAPPSPET